MKIATTYIIIILFLLSLLTISYNLKINSEKYDDIGQIIGHLINTDANKDIARNACEIYFKYHSIYDFDMYNDMSFYLKPANVNYGNEIVKLSPSTIIGRMPISKFDFPKEVTLQHPYFNTTPYRYVEFPPSYFFQK